jgi:hypothetical protein
VGIIDTFTDAFGRVAKKLWLIALPVLLDLFLWVGPKISIRPIVDKLVQMLNQSLSTLAAGTIPDVGTTEMMRTLIDTVQTTLGKTNLFALLAWGQLGVPSVAGALPVTENSPLVLQVSSYAVMLLLQILILGVGLLIAAAFLALLAQELREQARDWRRMARDILVYWVYLAAIFVPFGLFIILILSFSLMLGPLSVFAGVLVLWMLLYLAFVPQALTLFDQNPVRALLTSFTVVRTSLWPSVGFLLLSGIIRQGLGLVWSRLMASTTIGVIVAIAANAFVGTSLALAAFLFLRNRIALYRAALEQRSMGPS